MKNKFKLSLYLNYFLFAFLLNSVFLVILKSQNFYDKNFSGLKEKNSLELLRDVPIALFAFILTSFLPRIGYKRAILIALVALFLGCIGMASLGTCFWMPKVVLAIMGASFALVKLTVYSSIGILSKDKKGHYRFMGSIEGIFMLGIASAYFLFPTFNKQESSESLLRIYLYVAGICLISFIFLFFSKAKEVEIEKTSSLKENFFSMMYLIKHPFVILSILSVFLFAMIEQSLLTWVPSFNRKLLDLDKKTTINLAIGLALSIGLGRIIAGYLVRFFNWFKWVVFFTIIAMLVVLVGILFGIFSLLLFAPYDDMKIAEILSLTRVIFYFFVGFFLPFVGVGISPIYSLMNSAILTSLPHKVHIYLSGWIITFSALGGIIGSRLRGDYLKAPVNSFYYIIMPMALLLLTLFILYKRMNKNKIEVL